MNQSITAYEVSVFGRGITTWRTASAVHAAHLAQQLIKTYYYVLIESPNAPGFLYLTKDETKRRRI